MRNGIRAAAVAAVAAASLGLAGCSAESATDGGAAPGEGAGQFIAPEDVGKFHDALPEEIRSAGSLDFYIQQPNPPMEFTDLATDELMGVDPDLIASLGLLFDVEVEYHRVKEFSELIPAIQTGRGDLIISAVLDKKSRQEVVNLLDYFETGSQWVTAEGSDVERVEDLCGQSVSTGAGTNYIDQIAQVSEEVCESQGREPISTLTTVSIPEQMMMVTNGRAVANLQGVESAGYLLQTEEGKWRLLGEPFERAHYAVVFSKEDPELGKAVQQALDYMIEEGSYGEILEKWNVSDGAVEQTVLNGATTD